MWTNSLLKKNAWEALKNYYWVALGVTFIAGMLGANSSFSFNFNASAFSDLDLEYMDAEEVIATLLISLVIILFAWAIAICITTFLGGPVKCGQCGFFCKARNGDVNFSHLFDNFKSGNYMPTVKTMFSMQLSIFLWSLLLWVPGIIKAYEYYLVPYMLAENPRLSKDRAFEISRKTMDGEKWKLFILELSFIGWMLLGLLACCIGVYGVVPYFQATMAEFYMCMRAKMISYGYTSEEELNGSFYSDGFSNYTGGIPNGGNPYYNGNPPYGGNAPTFGNNPSNFNTPNNFNNSDAFNTVNPSEPKVSLKKSDTDTNSDHNNPYNS